MNRPVFLGFLLISAFLRLGPRTLPLQLLLPVCERLPMAQPAALLHDGKPTGFIGCTRHLSRSKAAASASDELEGIDSVWEGLRGNSSDARAITRSCAGLFPSQICAVSPPALQPGPSGPGETASRDSRALEAAAYLSTLPQNCPSRPVQPG